MTPRTLNLFLRPDLNSIDIFDAASTFSSPVQFPYPPVAFSLFLSHKLSALRSMLSPN